jgi:hypothetical protein
LYISGKIKDMKNLIGYVIGILLLIVALGSFSGDDYSITTGLLFLLAGLLCFPALLRLVGIDFLTKYNVILVIILVVIASATINNQIDKDIENQGIEEDKKDIKTEIDNGLGVFNTPKELCSILSKNGIGKLGDWKDWEDGLDFVASSSYYQFGSKNDGVGLENNIAYYLSGKENLVEELKIKLNINNDKEKENALKFLFNITEKTFNSLDLNSFFIIWIEDAIKNFTPFEAEIGNIYVSFLPDQNKNQSCEIKVITKNKKPYSSNFEILKKNVSRLRNSGSIKAINLTSNNIVWIEYVSDYEQYKELHPQIKFQKNPITKEYLDNYWETGDGIEKALVDGSIRVLAECDFVEIVGITIPWYDELDINRIMVFRSEFSNYTGLSLSDIKNDGNLKDPYVYDDAIRHKFRLKFSY